MNCRRCSLENLKDFNAEVAIHFPGWEGLEKPIVWAFPKLLVCLDCRFVEFRLPGPRLAELNSVAESQVIAKAA